MSCLGRAGDCGGRVETVAWVVQGGRGMTPKEIQPAVKKLIADHSADKPATIEEMAAAVGIDINAPGSWREVLDLADALALSPYVVKFYKNGERAYFPSSLAKA